MLSHRKADAAFHSEGIISLHSRRWVIEVLFWGLKQRLVIGGGKGMLFKAIRSQMKMIITSLRGMFPSS